jgi:outer membrane biosynthesis protein TonB
LKNTFSVHFIKIVSGFLSFLVFHFPFLSLSLFFLHLLTSFLFFLCSFSCGIKKMGDREKKYVHMLNATLCATGRAICCLLENYQDEGGVKIPEVLVPFMGGITYLPFVRDSKLATTIEKPLSNATTTTKGENKAPQPPKEEKKKEEKPAKEATTTTVKPLAAPKEEKKKAEKTTEGAENNKKEGKKEEKKEKKEKKEGGSAAPVPAKAAEPVFAQHPGSAGITAPPKYVSPAARTSTQARTSSHSSSSVPPTKTSDHHHETTTAHQKESTTHNNNSHNTYEGITFDNSEHPTKVTSVDFPQVEQRLMDYNYIFGDRAGVVDCLVFNHLFPTSSTTTNNTTATGMPEFPNMQRWKRHVGSFTQEQRQQWK